MVCDDRVNPTLISSTKGSDSAYCAAPCLSRTISADWEAVYALPMYVADSTDAKSSKAKSSKWTSLNSLRVDRCCCAPGWKWEYQRGVTSDLRFPNNLQATQMKARNASAICDLKLLYMVWKGWEENELQRNRLRTT